MQKSEQTELISTKNMRNKNYRKDALFNYNILTQKL